MKKQLILSTKNSDELKELMKLRFFTVYENGLDNFDLTNLFQHIKNMNYIIYQM